MINQPFLISPSKTVRLFFALGAMLVLSAAARGAALADIKNLMISAGDVITSGSQGFNIRSTGLNTVGINKTVYLVPIPKTGNADKISGYQWSVTTQPASGSVSIDSNSSGLFKFRPTQPGRYIVQMVPLDLNSAPTEAVTISIWASTYLGAEGDWSCATCHDGFYLPDKVTPWKGTLHATVLKRDLNGEHGNHISKSCLPCHAMGDYVNTLGDGNFYDVAQSIGFDLNLIGTWAADAANNGNPHWDDLPAALKTVASVQCESCHGPGKTHNGDTTRISVPLLDGSICISCHDGPPHHIHPDEWKNSNHYNSNTASSTVVNGECNKCHTTEGFVEKVVRGHADIATNITTRSAINCTGCHDPHDASNPHQIRTVAAVTLPNGKSFNFGMGNLCANCHNSRIADPNVTVDVNKGSSRGAHHGPQSDIILGTSAYDWGYSYSVGAGPHYLAVENGCVECHMAAAPAGVDTSVVPIGSHTFEITDPASGISTVESACTGCHEGLTTTDRILRIPHDFDGNGANQGVQTEVTGLLTNLKNQLLARLPGTSYNSTLETISISTADWKKLNLDQRAALYNFNIISEDRSRGVHNTRYAIAVLNRSYYYLMQHPYTKDYPNAYLVDIPRNNTRMEWDRLM
jgi:hypothetical protein